MERRGSQRRDRTAKRDDDLDWNCDGVFSRQLRHAVTLRTLDYMQKTAVLVQFSFDSALYKALELKSAGQKWFQANLDICNGRY